VFTRHEWSVSQDSSWAVCIIKNISPAPSSEVSNELHDSLTLQGMTISVLKKTVWSMYLAQ